jgi:hypothetical protein
MTLAIHKEASTLEQVKDDKSVTLKMFNEPKEVMDKN